jgi:acetyl esterase/lipase
MAQWTQWGSVDPELAAYLALLEPIDPDDLTGHRLLQRKQWSAAATVPDPRVTVGSFDDQFDVAAPPVRLRTYWAKAAGPFAPALVWLHGGGFAVGFCEIDDDLCSWLAGEVACHIFVPEYRLAPEHPYPAGFLDAYDTVAWVAGNAVALGIDRRRVAVGGASAGGALAAAVCQRAARPLPSNCWCTR